MKTKLILTVLSVILLLPISFGYPIIIYEDGVDIQLAKDVVRFYEDKIDYKYLKKITFSNDEKCILKQEFSGNYNDWYIDCFNGYYFGYIFDEEIKISDLYIYNLDKQSKDELYKTFLHELGHYHYLMFLHEYGNNERYAQNFRLK